jgi:hypothetical protein
MIKSTQLYKLHHNQVIRLKERETGDAAIFFLRLLMEGKNITSHIPKTYHQQICLLKQLTNLIDKGIHIPNTDKYMVLYVPSDVLMEISTLLWGALYKQGAIHTQDYVRGVFLSPMMNNYDRLTISK